MKKKKPDSRGFVYSTDPDFSFEEESKSQRSILPGQQQLKIRLDAKQRAGKAVTLVEGFIGTTEDREELGKKLKTFCGTGGSVKDEGILVQGDQREKVKQWLNKNGYSKVKVI